MSYERWRDELAGILDERFYTLGWLDTQVFNGAIRTLSTDTAIILFKFERYPTGWLELQGMAAAGDLESIKDELIPQAEALAKSMGCGSARIDSREGWGKVLKSQGYAPYQFGVLKAL